MTNWSTNDSRETYCLKKWSEGYVDVNEQGQLLVRPYRDAARGEVNLKKLVDEIQAQEIALPVLIRFQDILRDRIDQLCGAFQLAFRKHQYQAKYSAVYPIKVNQQFSVASEIANHGEGCVGLEAGSKPELMAVLSLAKTKQHVIICNGYKDRAYIRLALIARRLGHTIVIVIEKISELALVIEEAEKIQVEPILGLRLKLASIGKGKWQNTGGEKAKFGLSAEQILYAVETLKAQNCGHWISLLHFHMGSQIADLADIKTGLAEAAQYFVQLESLGIHITRLDIGGGMGVDYEGDESSGEFSVNYQPIDYADAVVECFKQVCTTHNLTTPDIITESGRAMTAHHAVLVTEVINAEQQIEIEQIDKLDFDTPLLQRAYSLYEDALSDDPILIHQQITALYHQAQSAFVKNNFSINDRAKLDKVYLACCQRLKKNLSHDKPVQQNLLDAINERLADKFVCNLSIFQSIPDVWGISQVFPIVPLQYLDQCPNRRAILQDLTCDSDGQIERYVDRYGLETSLPVHQVKADEKYLLGIFMVGAYQEILGDMHNLFGDTNTINVVLDENNKHQLCDPESGDSVRELLEYVHFNHDKMLAIYEQQIKQADLTATQQVEFLNALKTGLEAYTYMED